MAKKKVVTVYSKPNCVQCNATYRWLDGNGYKDEYEIADAVSATPAIAELLGYSQAPVIRVLDPETKSLVFWSGFNRDELIKHLQLPVPVAA